MGTILTKFSDAEVLIDSFTIYRSDRKVRQREGAAIYLRNDHNGKLAFSFSNSVIEYVIVKVKKLYAIIIAIYRPPDNTNEE